MIDFLIINSPFINKQKCGANSFTNENYLLIAEDDSDKFIKTPLILDSNNANLYYESGSAYLDKSNNKTYLVLGRGNIPNFNQGIDVFERVETNKYKLLKTIPAPKVMQGAVYADIVSFDLDSDGINEVIASIAEQKEGKFLWLGRYLQVLKFDGGSFVDKSDLVEQVPGLYKVLYLLVYNHY